MTRKRSLTQEQARAIRAEYKPGKVGYETLAKKYGVGASTIRDLVKNWTGGYL
jgi:transposase